jgi:hypothetical protein
MILTSESGLIISTTYGDEIHNQGNLLTSRFRRRERRLLAYALGFDPLLIWSVGMAKVSIACMR